MSYTFKRMLLATTAAFVASGRGFAQEAKVAVEQPAQDVQDAQVPLPNEATQTTLSGTPESQRTDIPQSDRAANVQDDIQVTGSRLADGDVTAQKTVIGRAQIKARGVTSVEDLLLLAPGQA